MLTHTLTNAKWIKARLSESAGGCVEVAFLDGGQVALRDSKDLEKAPHIYPLAVWLGFQDCLRRNDAAALARHRIRATVTRFGTTIEDADTAGAVVHTYTAWEWTCFLDGVNNHEFESAAA